MDFGGSAETSKMKRFWIDGDVFVENSTLNDDFISRTGGIYCGLNSLPRTNHDDRPVGEGGSEKEESDDRKSTEFHARVRYIKKNDSRMC